MHQQPIDALSRALEPARALRQATRTADPEASNLALWSNVSTELSKLPHLMTSAASSTWPVEAASARQISRLIRNVVAHLAPKARELQREFLIDVGAEFLVAEASSECLSAALCIVLDGVLTSGEGPIRLQSHSEVRPGAEPISAVEVSAPKLDLPESARKLAWRVFCGKGVEMSLLSEPTGARVQLLVPAN